MLSIVGDKCRLRALEPSDLELLYLWENDPEVWRVSGSCGPVSRERLQHFIEEQNYDIYATRQMRLIVESQGMAVGTLDIVDFDPQNSHFGIGILIYANENRRLGFASSAIEAIKEYGRTTLFVNQIWASVAEDNTPSVELFRVCGFEECGRRKAWLRREEGYIDEIEFQCLL
jgi:diamine N-acetyltransferase